MVDKDMIKKKDHYDLELENHDLIQEIKYNNQKDFWLTEYQCIISQFTKYVGLYFVVFVVYLGIQGFLLIGFFDSSDYIHKLLIIFSIICCLLFFFCTFVGWAVVSKLSRRKRKALLKLGFAENEVEDEFSIGKNATYVYVIFNSVLFYILIKLLFEVISS